MQIDALKLTLLTNYKQWNLNDHNTVTLKLTSNNRKLYFLAQSTEFKKSLYIAHEWRLVILYLMEIDKIVVYVNLVTKLSSPALSSHPAVVGDKCEVPKLIYSYKCNSIKNGKSSYSLCPLYYRA